MKVIFNNPVLFKELKLRFRSPKSFNGILFYLLAICLFVFGFIFMTTSSMGTSYFRPSESYILFTLLSFIQLGLVLFITPGLTAGAISSEREKQTLSILLTTSQSSFQIITGKLFSSIAFLVLLIVAGLPVYSLVFLFGGISPMDFAKVFLFLFVTVLAIGSVGIMFSTLIRRTIVSMIVTYGTMLFLSVVTGFLFLLMRQMTMFGSFTGTGMTTPSPSIVSHILASVNPAMLFASFTSPGIAGAILEVTQVKFPIWIGYLIFYILLTVLSLFIAIKRLRVNMKRSK
ncbi:ABC transporter permease [Sporosarcina limicola]|uniref:ABC-type transport system involved in multi-copper enzyme maturation permease subunit n=1 Tax=Sporosarcina limicola TaxID=34101 RepID=A0A927MFQ7_9BACL|nr:ABC transporter permease [Sporosarcina limicola]MBE1553630.1 ABC-type transport system involved in multi-copper enzyme maturation permease subunit [Sporosarcina limicola]